MTWTSSDCFGGVNGGSGVLKFSIKELDQGCGDIAITESADARRVELVDPDEVV